MVARHEHQVVVERDWRDDSGVDGRKIPREGGPSKDRFHRRHPRIDDLDDDISAAEHTAVDRGLVVADERIADLDTV